MKPCSKCLVTKPLEDFRKHKKGRLGRTAECIECLRARNREWQKANPARVKEISRAYYERHTERAIGFSKRYARVTGWWMHLAARTKSNARIRGHEYGLDPQFILELFEKQNGLCYWFNIPLVPSIGTREPQQPSLDRLDPAKGYTRDNVVLSCQFANIGRSTLSVDKFRAFIELLRESWQTRAA